MQSRTVLGANVNCGKQVRAVPVCFTVSFDVLRNALWAHSAKRHPVGHRLG